MRRVIGRLGAVGKIAGGQTGQFEGAGKNLERSWKSGRLHGGLWEAAYHVPECHSRHMSAGR